MQTTNDTLYLVQSHLYLLECVLVTYEDLCRKRRQPKQELDRLEFIVESSLNALGKDLVLAVRGQPLYFKHNWEHMPRVDQLVGFMRAGESIQEARSRYSLKYRYLGQVT